MMIGLMWQDLTTDPLETKIGRAVEYYLSKYGKAPSLCIVHPSQVQGVTSYGEVVVRSNKHVRRNHFWVGTGEREVSPMP